MLEKLKWHVSNSNHTNACLILEFHSFIWFPQKSSPKAASCHKPTTTTLYVYILCEKHMHLKCDFILSFGYEFS